MLLDGKEVYGRWVPPSYLLERPTDDKINYYKVTSVTEGKPHLIAYEVYGTELLDWVIIAFNDVRDPLNWPEAGTIIMYPSETIVLPELF